MNLFEFADRAAATLKSLVKVAAGSRPTRFERVGHGRTLVILANGPSLNETIRESFDTLKRVDTMSVNFAPLAEVFFEIRPKFHVLADPVFFAEQPAENVERLYEALGKVDWPLRMLVPRNFVGAMRKRLAANGNIDVAGFNFVGAGGFGAIECLLYRKRLAMPRPRNVLIPSLMCGIWLGYETIYIAGADHSWMQTISVDSDNRVISVQPHFYKDDEREQKRVDTAYRDLRLHDVVHSFYVAFKSYHHLRRFADREGVRIINATPGSFIDAFERGGLP